MEIPMTKNTNVSMDFYCDGRSKCEHLGNEKQVGHYCKLFNRYVRSERDGLRHIKCDECVDNCLKYLRE